MNGGISIDTNIAIRLFKNDPVIIKMFSGLSTIYLTVPVVAELLFAAKNSGRPQDNLDIYNGFINTCNILDITKETADHYSSIRLDLKHKGRPIPENDLWIASICIEQNLSLATEDSHFNNIDKLKVLKW